MSNHENHISPARAASNAIREQRALDASQGTTRTPPAPAPGAGCLALTVGFVVLLVIGAIAGALGGYEDTSGGGGKSQHQGCVDRLTGAGYGHGESDDACRTLRSYVSGN